jgi:flagellar biosynthesis chaperone FliJ|tara:strand:+ start:67 stop:423 length:357 start_codon:yes stop_codon:yes gene_type:complete
MAVTAESNLAKKLDKAQTEVTFSEEELQSLRNLQSEYSEKSAQFGQLKIQKLLIQQQLDALETAEVQMESDYSALQTREQEIVKNLNEKYGPGNLDPATGVFTPAPVPDRITETSETT